MRAQRSRNKREGGVKKAQAPSRRKSSRTEEEDLRDGYRG